MISLQLPIEARKLLAFEACSYSIMMSRIVISTFIDAVAFCCIRHGLTDSLEIDKFKKLKSDIAEAIEEISKDAGVPSDTKKESSERFKERQDRPCVELEIST